MLDYHKVLWENHNKAQRWQEVSRWVAIWDKEKPALVGVIQPKAGREWAMQMPWRCPGKAFQGCRASSQAPQWAQTSEVQELQGAGRAGGSEQLGEQPSWGWALEKGEHVLTTLCFLGFYWESSRTGGFGRKCPDLTEVLAFHCNGDSRRMCVRVEVRRLAGRPLQNSSLGMVVD